MLPVLCQLGCYLIGVWWLVVPANGGVVTLDQRSERFMADGRPDSVQPCAPVEHSRSCRKSMHVHKQSAAQPFSVDVINYYERSLQYNGKNQYERSGPA